MRPGPRQDVRTPPLFLSLSSPKAHEAQTPQPIEHMTTTPTELRSLTNRAILATAALAPFALGTGHDSHGDPVPDAEAVIRRGLLALVEAGRLANAALEGSDAMASLPDASTGAPE